MSSRDVCVCVCVCVCVQAGVSVFASSSHHPPNSICRPYGSPQKPPKIIWLPPGDAESEYYVLEQIPNRPLSKCQFLPYQFYSLLTVCLSAYVAIISQKPEPETGLTWLQEPGRHTWRPSEWAPGGNPGTVIAASSDIPSWSANLQWNGEEGVRLQIGKSLRSFRSFQGFQTYPR